MGYNKPVVVEIAYKTYAINEFGMATSFLVVGTAFRFDIKTHFV